MGRRNRGKQKRDSFSLLLSFGSLVISGVSLLVAWQANELGKQANEILALSNSDMMLISGLAYAGGGEVSATDQAPSGQNYSWCAHKVRVSNIGGAPGSIVDFVIELEQQDESYLYKGFGEGRATSVSQPFASLPIHNFQTVLIGEGELDLSKISTEVLGQYNPASALPLQIQGQSTIDLIALTSWQVDNYHPDIGIFLIGRVGPIPDPDVNLYIEEIENLTVRISFVLAGGGIVTSDPIVCISFDTYER